MTSTTYNGGEGNNSYVLKNIVNRKGFQLPVTGGFGTLLFSGIGVLLVAGRCGGAVQHEKEERPRLKPHDANTKR